MTTATTSTRSEQKVCAQMLTGIAAVGISIHFIHEAVVLFGEVPLFQQIVGLVLVAATWALGAAWYRMSRATRRGAAGVLGLFWAMAAGSEHLGNLGDAGALDYTGLLTFAGGLLLIVAAFYDHFRPMEPTQ